MTTGILFRRYNNVFPAKAIINPISSFPYCPHYPQCSLGIDRLSAPRGQTGYRLCGH